MVAPWRARTDRTRAAIALKNGSDLPAALKRAHGIASDVADDEVARVIVLSDMRTKNAIGEREIAAAFAADARDHATAPLTHAIAIADGLDVEEPLSWTR